MTLRDAALDLSEHCAGSAGCARARGRAGRRRSRTRSCSRPGPSRRHAHARGERRLGRTRPHRRRGRRRPASPRCAPTTTATLSGRLRRTRAGEVRAAARHVHARVSPCGARDLLARLRDRLVRDAARVHDGDVSAALDLGVTVGEQTLANPLNVGLRDLAAEEAGGERRHHAGSYATRLRRTTKPVRGPAVQHATFDVRPPAHLRRVAPRGSRMPRARRRETLAASDSTAGRAMFATALDVTGRSSRVTSPSSASTTTPFAAAFARVVSIAKGSSSNACTGAKAELRRRRPRGRRSRSRRRGAGRAARPEGARGRAASSRARRFRTRARGRSRSRSRRSVRPPTDGPTQNGPARAGRWKARQRSAQPGGTSSSRTAPNARAIRAPASASVYAASSSSGPRSRSSNPSGASSSISARASSARSTGTRTDTRRTALSGTRSSASRRTPRRDGSSPRPCRARTPPAARAVRRRAGAGTTTFTSTRWSPRPKPWRTGIPRPFRTRISPGCVPASNASSSCAVERFDRARRPERGLDDRQVDRRVDVVALADETRIAVDAHAHVDVAGGPAEAADVTRRR